MTNEVKNFYIEYGMRDWNRLEIDAYSKINFILHMHFIKKHLKKGRKILDTGCGPGRFSIEFTKAGCNVTLFDISDDQLRIAENKINKAQIEKNIDGIYQGDIRDLSQFENESFDIVVCYGAPLNYILQNREKIIQEFNRVLKNNGKLFVSVNNKWGVFKTLLGNQMPDFFNNPEYWYIDKVIKTGDLLEHEKVKQPARHFFEAKELEQLLADNGFSDVILAASPCFCTGNSSQVEEIAKDKKALETIIDIELATYTNPSMVGLGEFILAKGVKTNNQQT